MGDWGEMGREETRNYIADTLQLKILWLQKLIPCGVTYLPYLCIDIVVSRLSSDDCSDLHTIGVTCLTIHRHV